MVRRPLGSARDPHPGGDRQRTRRRTAQCPRWSVRRTFLRTGHMPAAHGSHARGARVASPTVHGATARMRKDSAPWVWILGEGSMGPVRRALNPAVQFSYTRWDGRCRSQVSSASPWECDSHFFPRGRARHAVNPRATRSHAVTRGVTVHTPTNRGARSQVPRSHEQCVHARNPSHQIGRTSRNATSETGHFKNGWVHAQRGWFKREGVRAVNTPPIGTPRMEARTALHHE